jgi:hypothetical protein
MLLLLLEQASHTSKNNQNVTLNVASCPGVLWVWLTVRETSALMMRHLHDFSGIWTNHVDAKHSLRLLVHNHFHQSSLLTARQSVLHWLELANVDVHVPSKALDTFIFCTANSTQWRLAEDLHVQAPL